LSIAASSTRSRSGGSEKGWRWYREGKLAKKMNTFTDFIAASEYLSQSGWCAPGKVVAEGGSAGGTLIGAVGNMRPDLYAGLIAGMPFVDVLNTMLDETLPLTLPEWPEWGDPIRDAAAFRTILAYSPYENVRVQSYPAILALAGLTDPRVLYWEPAKWPHGRQHDCLSHQPRRRSRWRRGPLRPSQGSGARLCLRDQGRGRSTVTTSMAEKTDARSW
jgi:protease II